MRVGAAQRRSLVLLFLAARHSSRGKRAAGVHQGVIRASPLVPHHVTDVSVLGFGDGPRQQNAKAIAPGAANSIDIVQRQELGLQPAFHRFEVVA
jgi:hypothetical protein